MFEFFFNKINQTLEKYVPYKYLSWKQQKTAGKPWITKGILTSIKIKNKINNKFCRARNETIKNQLLIQLKKSHNLITTLTKKSEDSHFETLFDENKKDSLKIWQGIKELLRQNDLNHYNQKMLNINKKLTTNNYAIATEFNTLLNTTTGK